MNDNASTTWLDPIPAADSITPTWPAPELSPSLQLARRYMRECRSGLIDAAIRDGYTRSLQRLCAQHIREFQSQHGRFPSLTELEGWRLSGTTLRGLEKYGEILGVRDMMEIGRSRAELRRRGWK
jgi:hypothetical protein